MPLRAAPMLKENEPVNIQQPIRLSHLSHGGGCGCKLAPAVLQVVVEA